MSRAGGRPDDVRGDERRDPDRRRAGCGGGVHIDSEFSVRRAAAADLSGGRLAAGEDGLGIQFDNLGAAYFVGSVALAIILFDSGFATRLATLRTAAFPALTLATAGVLLTAVLVGFAAQVFLGFTWLQGLLLGVIVAPTDAAAVFFLLRVGGITLRDLVRSTLEVESGSNDPIAIFLTVALVGAGRRAGRAGRHRLAVLLPLAIQLVVGAAVGFLGGMVIVQAVNRTNFEPALYPIVVTALALVTYAVAGLAWGSGFLAVYVAGLVSGNARTRHLTALRRFQEGTTWLSQIAMFLTLGLLATPSEFPAVALAAVGIAAFLILVARPVAVWLCLLPFRFSRHETAFVSWVGLRGAVSILLAILPVMAGIPGGRVMFNTAFMVVLASLLVQGWTIAPMARFLGWWCRRGAARWTEWSWNCRAAAATRSSPIRFTRRAPSPRASAFRAGRSRRWSCATGARCARTVSASRSPATAST